MSEKLYIVIPAYNEEMNVEDVVREWHGIVKRVGLDSRLVIIDDGSKDKTYNKLQELSLEYSQLMPVTKPNGGHGATVLYGYHLALDEGADYIFQTDSDGQTIAEEFWPLWEQRAEYDAQIGHRNHREDGASRVFVTKVLKLVLFLVFGESIQDANTPFRLISSDIMKKHIVNIPKDFNLSNVMLTVSLVKEKENIRFLPITFRPRQGGVNSINFRRIIGIGRQAVKDFIAIRRELYSK